MDPRPMTRFEFWLLIVTFAVGLPIAQRFGPMAGVGTVLAGSLVNVLVRVFRPVRR